MKIILGSQSPRRLEILRRIVPSGVVVETRPTRLDERVVCRSMIPGRVCAELAIRKSCALRVMVAEPAVLVTADTITVCGRELREKPADEMQARIWLDSYRRHPLSVITAVMLYDTRSGFATSFVDMASVQFSGFPLRVIDQIIQDGTALSCAGAVMVEHPLFRPRVNRIIGDVSTVQGLPLQWTRQMLRALFA